VLAGVRRDVRARAWHVLEKYAFWRGVRSALADRELFRRLTGGAVVLMYHAVGAVDEPPSHYVVPLRRFKRQMAWLRWTGRPVITVGDLVTHLKSGIPPPVSAVIISFDDGYADNYREALPALRDHGFRATIFVVSSHIGGVAPWGDDPILRGRQLLTAGQVEALRSEGCEIGGHSRTHPSLVEIASDDLEVEIGGSRRDLEQLSGHPIRTFAYPFGDFDPTVARTVRDCGYEGACCSRSGINELSTPLFELRRVEVRGTDSLWQFIGMVWRGRRSRRSGLLRSGGRVG
jgi:peptidoglycan/xylan/chitin deacetylase (PgdA/CDA1 family)